MVTNKIRGTWKLTSFEFKSEEGDTYFPFGEVPKGFLIYDKGGYMSGMMSRSDRPNLSTDNLSKMPENEKSSLADGFIGYSGKYEILSDKIIHHVEMSFIPNWISTPLERFYEFDNNSLILKTAPEEFNGKKFVYRMIWKKLD